MKRVGSHTMILLILLAELVMGGIPEVTVTLTRGETGTFTCEPWPYSPSRSYGFGDYSQDDKYLCRDPCGPSNWHLVVVTTAKGTPNTGNRFSIVKTTGTTRNAARVTIRAVEKRDEGVYWCAIDRPYTDLYQRVVVTVEEPQPKATDSIIPQNAMVEDPPDEEVFSDLDTLDPSGKVTRRALRRCGDNSACALALLHKEDLRIDGDCWICHALTARWQTKPLTVETAQQGHAAGSQGTTEGNSCTFPRSMLMVLYAGQLIRENKPVVPHPNATCVDDHPVASNMAFEVPLHHAETCVCSNHAKGPKLGWSSCATRMRVDTAKSLNCTSRWPNDTTYAFQCPFSQLTSQSGLMWVCGRKAFHLLPPQFGWAGCCHPAVVTTGTTIYSAPESQPDQHQRRRRSLTEDGTGVPRGYQGYTLADPWTAPGANIGWSMFLGVGTAVAINKINGLAWSVLKLANETEAALTMVDGEMTAIRTAVIQHRLALDILLAERGGVCKLLNISCCFYIPDEHENITNVIKHMREAIRVPPAADNSWFAWLTQLWGGWGYWMIHVMIPVVIGFIFLLCMGPCVCQCLQRMITTSLSRDYRMLRQSDSEEMEEAVEWIPPFKDELSMD